MFGSWCSRQGVDQCNSSAGEICLFLQHPLDKGTAYRTLGVYQSAISKYHASLNGKPIGQHKDIGRFLKVAFIKNPPSRTLLPSWNLDNILKALKKEHFEPLEKATKGTLKVVFLVAVSLGKGCSEIQAMGRSVPYLRMEAGGVRVRPVPAFLSKTATPHLGRDIFLPTISPI